MNMRKHHYHCIFWMVLAITRTASESIKCARCSVSRMDQSEGYPECFFPRISDCAAGEAGCFTIFDGDQRVEKAGCVKDGSTAVTCATTSCTKAEYCAVSECNKNSAVNSKAATLTKILPTKTLSYSSLKCYHCSDIPEMQLRGWTSCSNGSSPVSKPCLTGETMCYKFTINGVENRACKGNSNVFCENFGPGSDNFSCESEGCGTENCNLLPGQQPSQQSGEQSGQQNERSGGQPQTNPTSGLSVFQISSLLLLSSAAISLFVNA